MSINLEVFDSYTVIVLGAGASAHLGYPVGETLRDKILKNTEDPNAVSFTQLREMDFKQDLISEFHEAFAASGASTIDAFLEKRQEFVDVGRAAIALELIKYEDQDKLRVGGNNWYRKLREEVARQINDNDPHGLVLVTFNYDRSIDKFLHDFFISTFPTRAKSERIERWVPILHVHGRLGYLDHEKGFEPLRPYKPTASSEEILASSRSIRVPVEFKDKRLGSEMVYARKAITSDQARQVVFLGFGYDSTNLRRLLIDDRFADRRWIGDKKYLGTAYNLPISRIKELSAVSQGRLTLGDPTTPIYEFLDKQSCWGSTLDAINRRAT